MTPRLPETITIDASIVVKWFKKGETHEQEALSVREEIFTTKVHAIAPEWLYLEVIRALVKIGYPKNKIEEAYASLREAASLDLIEVVPMNRFLDKAREAEIELKLFASDSTYLATAIVEKADLLTEDKHLLNRRVLTYAEKEGIHILALDEVRSSFYDEKFKIREHS